MFRADAPQHRTKPHPRARPAEGKSCCRLARAGACSDVATSLKIIDTLRERFGVSLSPHHGDQVRLSRYPVGGTATRAHRQPGLRLSGHVPQLALEWLHDRFQNNFSSTQGAFGRVSPHNSSRGNANLAVPSLCRDLVLRDLPAAWGGRVY